MQLKPEALDSHLQNTLSSVYVVSSDEYLLKQEAEDSIRATARSQGILEREVLSVERGFKWSALQAAACTMSLFGDKKLIELRIPTGRPGKEGGAILQEYVQSPPPDYVTLISLPRLDWTTQKTAWVQALQKHGTYIDIPLVERTQLPAWIRQRLARQNQQTDADSLEFLTDRLEGNLLAAWQEIRKLGLLYPEGTLSFEQIRDSVLNVARYDIFKLNEAMLAGDVKRLMRMLEGLKGEGEPLPLILWAITDEIRTLLKIRSGLDSGQALPNLLKTLRIRSPKERLIQMALRRLETPLLRKALQQAADTDKIIKGLRADSVIGESWNAIQYLALMIARPRPMPRNAP